MYETLAEYYQTFGDFDKEIESLGERYNIFE